MHSLKHVTVTTWWKGNFRWLRVLQVAYPTSNKSFLDTWILSFFFLVETLQTMLQECCLKSLSGSAFTPHFRFHFLLFPPLTPIPYFCFQHLEYLDPSLTFYYNSTLITILFQVVNKVLFNSTAIFYYIKFRIQKHKTSFFIANTIMFILLSFTVYL